MRAYLVGLIALQGTGVGLARGQAELCQYVKNLPALDFHLAREIVDTNLTHPPLFKLCFPKPIEHFPNSREIAEVCEMWLFLEGKATSIPWLLVQLFGKCSVAHSYLMALAVLKTSVIV
jgi:hypothetical protein